MSSARWFRLGAAALAAVLVTTPVACGSDADPPGASAAVVGGSLDLRVLVVSVADQLGDPGLGLMARTLDQVGVPYDVLDSSTTELTEATLRTGTRGHYNGIILTQADLYTPSGSGFSLEEWQRLHAYERDFGVREAVVAGFPATDPTRDLDYGMGDVISVPTAVGRWVAPAGSGRMFSYVNTATPLDVAEYSFASRPRGGEGAPAVTPLLVDDADPSRTLVSQLDYPDGRQVLLSTVGNAWFRLHSNVLAYQFLDFATRGLFLGGRFVSLSTHTDDMFLADDLWNPATKQTDPTLSYRMTPQDLDAVVAGQNAFRAAHPLAAGWEVQFPFNGIGARSWTPNPRVSRAVAEDATLVRSTSTNYGASATTTVSRNGTNSESRVALRSGTVTAPPAPPADRVDRVLLRLTATAATGPLPVDVCRLTQTWTEGSGRGGGFDFFGVSWRNRQTFTSWQTAGGTHDTASCIRLQIAGAGVSELDITPIWRSWSTGLANAGVVVKPAGTGSVTFASAENATVANRPTLEFETSAAPEPLTARVLQTSGEFGWINHTYSALQMDRLCPDPDEPQPVECPVTDYATAFSEIDRNRQTWQTLGLPGYTPGLAYLLSDSHAGLHDRRGTEEDPSDDIPFPQGSNPNFLQAAQDLGVQYIAADASRPNQDREQRIPGFNLILLPRYPTNIYVNATTPAENIDEYNWLYHGRHLAAGNDLCTIPGAICTPRTYDQMLAAEADTTVNHMLSGRAWPHYFHQSNLRNHNAGRSLQLDWMNAVMDRYEQLFTLPVKTPAAHQLGPDALDRIVTQENNVRGWLDLDTNTVTLIADNQTRPLITGLTNGQTYGGQPIGHITVTTTPQTFSVEPDAGG